MGRFFEVSNLRNRCGGMEVSDARPKKLLAQSMLGAATLKEALGKF
jgi:hypothetical protein